MIRQILFSVFLLSGGVAATAQNQYVSLFNYHSSALNPVVYIPGVTWVVQDNSAYDVNHQRFFFQGNATRQPPWYLYCVDVATGAILSSPQVPSNNPAGAIEGMQYDNSVDTLYTLYYDGNGNTYFAWIDIPSGTVYPKQLIPGFPGYTGSTYDSAQHLYICNAGGGQLLTLDARTGNPVYSATFAIANTFNLVYDNANSLLYGISASPGSPATFDSISLATGALHPLTTLTVSAFPQINAYSIDETGGNYIFVGTLPSVSNCVNFELYTVNIASATITDSSLYPYAQDPTDPIDSNLLEFSFDNRRDQLYALNWRPTVNTIAPVITISAAADSVCPGQSDLFTATLTSPQATNNYQWLVDEQPAGSNASTYTLTNPANGDSIRCILTATTVCGSTFIDTSGPVVIGVRTIPFTALRIAASANDICPGDTVLFQATPTDGGSTPQFQWLINGQAAGPNSDTFPCTTLANGDNVSCILQSSLTCALPDTAGNTLVMAVKPGPELQMPADPLIARGQQVQLSPSITGAATGYQWQPPTALSGTSIPDPVASPDSTTTYQLTVSDSDGCAETGKVTVRVVTPLFMPNAFTPGGVSNGVFRIPPSLSIELIQFAIYDRWGQRVFATANSADGWDGTIAGRRAPGGAYVWIIAYTDPFKGVSVTASGTVILIR
jgi:gliding motility-associated-like protein